jgi:L-cysteine desulfidase
VVPFLNRRGLRTVVAAGLSSAAHQLNLFPAIDRRVTRLLLRRGSWLKVGRAARQEGVYVKAVLSTPKESVTVVIEGHHDEIRLISRNGQTIFRASPKPHRPISMAQIMTVVAKRDRQLETMARDFIVRQVRGDPSRPLAKRISGLIKDRMCGAALPVMTIVGSGNHGILLGVPFHDLYQKKGARMLPAVLFSLLTVIHMTGKRSRISDECGLATKAAPALIAGMAYARGASLAQIIRLMSSVSHTLRHLKCHGARASCGRKGEQAVSIVLAEVEAWIYDR